MVPSASLDLLPSKVTAIGATPLPLLAISNAAGG